MSDRRDRRNNMNVRRDDGTFNIIPIALGLALLLGAGYLLMNMMSPNSNTGVQRSSDAPVTSPRNAPAFPDNATTPRTTPTPPK